MIATHEDTRLLDNLRFACGPLMAGALEDEGVIEIMLNPDSSLWIERYGQDHEKIGEISRKDAESIMFLVASALKLTVNEKSPIVEGEFLLTAPGLKARFRPLSGLGRRSLSAKRQAGCLPSKNT